MTPSRSLPFIRLLTIVCVVLGLVAAYRIVNVIYAINSTGTLVISTGNEPDAQIVISQYNHQAAFIGQGQATVRLRPGDYVVSAKLSGNQTYAVVHITAKHVTKQMLNPVKTQVLPATTDAGYINFDQLSSNGLSEDQIGYLKDLLNQFNSNAKAISLDPLSIQSAPHDPNSDDSFVLTFSVTVDGTNYLATVTYPDDQSVQLSLTNQTGIQVFNGFAPSSPDS